MKLKIDRSTFLKALSHGQSVVERRNTVPILGHVLLKAENDCLRLTTTDMDLALVETITATVETPGSTTVSAQMLFDIVRKLPDSAEIDLSLNDDNGQLTLKAGRSRFSLSSLPAEQFPQLTQDDLPHTLDIDAEMLRRLIDRAKFAMSTEDTRYYLNGIYLHIIERKGQTILRSVATDAHRLACIEVQLPGNTDNIPGVIIGRKSVTELRKLLDNVDGPLKIRLSATRIEFDLPNATLSSRLIDGAYPDYEQAIPQANDKPLILDAKAFASAVDRVATVVSDKIRVIKMNVTNNSLTLSANSHELGSATEEMQVDFASTTPIEIGFNAKYLLDIAQQIGEDEAHIMLADGNSPAIIRSLNDQDAMYVLMPMRV